MPDEYTGNLNVGATAELSPFLSSLAFNGPYPLISTICYNEVPKTPTITYTQAQGMTHVSDLIRNDGDETIEAYIYYIIDALIERETPVSTISPGANNLPGGGDLPAQAMSVGVHTISWILKARVPGGIWNDYYTASTTYTVEAEPCTCTAWANVECTAVGKRRQTRTCTPPGCDIEERIIDDVSCRADGDITRVTLDGKLLPEGGTLDWILNDDAAVKIYFKNTGNASSVFHIWLIDETGSTITGCDIMTEAIPPDAIEYYVDLCVFLPDVVKVKTLTAHIES